MPAEIKEENCVGEKTSVQADGEKKKKIIITVSMSVTVWVTGNIML